MQAARETYFGPVARLAGSHCGLEAFPVRSAEAFGDDEIEVGAHRFFAAEAEDADGAVVPETDGAVAVAEDDRIGGVFENALVIVGGQGLQI